MSFKQFLPSNSNGAGVAQMDNKDVADRRTVTPPERIVPHPGRPFRVAIDDVVESIQLAPCWLYFGWIDVRWKYRRTRLGAFWHTLGLGGFVLVMGVVWSTILSQDPRQYFLFVSTGLVCWSLIATFITDGSNIFISGMSTSLNMRYPYAAFGFAHVWRSLLLFSHHFIVILVVFLLTAQWPDASVLYVLPGLIIVLLNGLWMSVLAGLICLWRRDLAPAIATAMQIMIFVTPVFWPKGLLGEDLAYAADLNPLYHLLQVVRDPLLGNSPALEHWFWTVGTLVFGLLITSWTYGRCRDRFSYWY